MRTAVLTLLLCLISAAPAAAAEVDLRVAPGGGVVLGEEHRFSGTLSENGAPLGGRVVTLEARRHPYTDAFAPLDTATTGPEGEFRFTEALDRNHEVRVVAMEAGAASPAVRAYVFPRGRLSVRTVRRNVVRIRQTLIVTRNAGLRGLTRFYVGPRRSRTARFAGAARPRRVRPDRYVAEVDVRIPRRYRGRFSYGACIRTTGESRFGDPGERCPRRTFRF